MEQYSSLWESIGNTFRRGKATALSPIMDVDEQGDGSKRPISASRARTYQKRPRSSSQSSPYLSTILTRSKARRLYSSVVSAVDEIEARLPMLKLLKKNTLFTKKISKSATEAISKDITPLIKDLPQESREKLGLSLNESNTKKSSITEIKLYYVNPRFLNEDEKGILYNYIIGFYSNCNAYDKDGLPNTLVNMEYFYDSYEAASLLCVAVATHGSIIYTKGTKAPVDYKGDFVCGFTTLQYMTWNDHVEKFGTHFNRLNGGTYNRSIFLGNETMKKTWILYIDVICSGFAVGGEILSSLEDPRIVKHISSNARVKYGLQDQYSMLSLTSIPSAYTYYSSKMNYSRSLDQQKAFPIIRISRTEWDEARELLEEKGIDIKGIFEVFDVTIKYYWIFKISGRFSTLLGLYKAKGKEVPPSLTKPLDYSSKRLYLYTKRVAE